MTLIFTISSTNLVLPPLSRYKNEREGERERGGRGERKGGRTTVFGA